MTFDTPVALIIFNRPETTKRVFAQIARVRPRVLRVIADGPRPDRPGDVEGVAAARSIVDAVDWPCELRRNYSDENMGCKRRIASGLNWVFREASEAVILEDDCVPDPTFFPYCRELLGRYRDDERVMAVTGNNFQNGFSRTKYSYYFSKFPHCWGWATWRRAWAKFDLHMESWPAFKEAGGLRGLCASAEEEAYWVDVFDEQRAGTTKSWSIAWLYNCWSQSGLAALPDMNLVSNIGFGFDATHTRDSGSLLANLPTAPIRRLQHPPFVIRHVEADAYTFETIFRPAPAVPEKGWCGRLRERLRAIRPGGGDRRPTTPAATAHPARREKCA